MSHYLQMKWSLTRRKATRSSHSFPPLMHSLHRVQARGLATVALLRPTQQPNQRSKRVPNQKYRNSRPHVCNPPPKTTNIVYNTWQALLQNQHSKSQAMETVILHYHGSQTKIGGNNTKKQDKLPFPISSISNTPTGHLFLSSSASSSSTSCKSIT